MTVHPQRIHALPLQLANQIAAGEVVERPASVLKELVENSIDAGATQIDISIEAAGRELIRVSDNGSGIHPDDLVLALSRHATSKLLSSEQLSQIASLGFRGEALPSIASVSRLTLISKQADTPCGWQVNSDSETAEPASHPNGTSVSVAELFFNLPARRHFLRSDKTELHHLQTTLNRLALSRFDVGFNARLSDQLTMCLPALEQTQQYASRISKICGQAFVRDAVYLQQDYDDIKLHGWVGKANAHRAQTDVQYFFINGRVIKDRVINHAIRLAYGDQLPQGRQPAYVLYLTLPLDKVDVNVHPTKHEVRFRDARLIHGLITRALSEAISHSDNALNITAQPSLDLPVQDSSTTQSGHIAEIRNPYTLSTSKNTSRGSAPSLSTMAFTLLFQRYILLMQPSPGLLDLQQLEREQRQQQWQHAIDQSDVASRTILVPTKLALEPDAVPLFEQQETMLAETGFAFTLTPTHITFRRIPFLLSSLELSELLAMLTTALKLSTDKKTLAEKLTQALPLIPITSQAQAEQLLLPLGIDAIVQSKFYRKLDSAALADLFST